MGYRFSIKNANSVGHLVEGNILTFTEQTLSSFEFYMPNMEFIDNFISNPTRDLYSSRNVEREIREELGEIYYKWRDIKNYMYDIVEEYRFRKANGEKFDFSTIQEFTDILSVIHRQLAGCEYKSLILPGFDYNQFNEYLTSEDTIRELVETHPGASCLILQLKGLEGLKGEGQFTLLNAFSKFNQAYKRIEQWPGILVWKDNESTFLPVKNVDEVHEVYRIIKYERRNAISYLNRRFIDNQNNKKYFYLLHMSDLHFGNQIANNRKVRLLKLIQNQRNEIEESAVLYPVITGDLVDSPTVENRQSFLDFIELLNAKGFHKPSYILGNHDVDTGGFIKRLTMQKSIISSLVNQSKIDIIPELNLGLIKFDSNTGGELAQGKIGTEQLQLLGNEIDDLLLSYKNLNFIALVHHHPLPIENPIWYEADWYEKLLGNSGYEITMKLKDSSIFLEWLRQRGIKCVLHGHKHIPNVQDYAGIKIIGAGSSTGVIKHKDEGKTYLSYNVIKYDIDNKKPLHCSIFAEEIIGAGVQHINLYPF